MDIFKTQIAQQSIRLKPEFKVLEEEINEPATMPLTTFVKILKNITGKGQTNSSLGI